MKKLQYSLFKILSFSPVIRITDDSKFNKITKEPKKIRYSLLSFNLGTKSFYLFTYTDKEGFKFLYILDLYEVQKYHEIIEKNGDEYDEYLRELYLKSPERRIVEKEFILFKITEEVNIKNKTFNKFLAYIAIIAFILPLYSPKITELSSYLESYKLFFTIGIFYLFVNIICLSYSYIKIKGYNRTLLSSLRKNENPGILLVALLFYEWKNTVNESVMGISIIKNIEKYMFMLIILSGVIIISSNIDTWKMSKDPKNTIIEESAVESAFFNLKSEPNINLFLKRNEEQVERINNALLSEEYKTLLMISDESSKIINEYKKLLDFYKSQKVRIIKIKNDELSENIEIILLKE
ncbi:hypothetical protein [Exiguobacterium alkaliphilum]|uniref:Uncharacterized protein n=1 Tax=Exiguobacterium alkaliphilum TaxID=1428684 RepID=A0ABT2L0P9_9BACL|nr:hypothetical protein [Exiguobacterium alkaliphilum]MCT4795421.1 hypothetical protein [Exiguobacterium alkaliphilum]